VHPDNKKIAGRNDAQETVYAPLYITLPSPTIVDDILLKIRAKNRIATKF